LGGEGDLMKPPAHEPSLPPVDAVSSEIINIAQVAEYLHTHPSTIYRLLKSRKIPAFRLGSDWASGRADIEKWIAAQEIKVADEEPAAANAGGNAPRAGWPQGSHVGLAHDDCRGRKVSNPSPTLKTMKH
jgi:excisionase family DNA binding protein